MRCGRVGGALGRRIAAFDREFRGAEKTIDRFVAEHCALPVVQVEADEYAFAGVPNELSPGLTTFELTNIGEEPHEMTIFEIAAGARGSVGELGSSSAVPEGLTFAGSTFRPPGGTDITYLDLAPGSYVAVCLIQVGATATGPPAAAAPPHLDRGMVIEFEVTIDSGEANR